MRLPGAFRLAISSRASELKPQRDLDKLVVSPVLVQTQHSAEHELVKKRNGKRKGSMGWAVNHSLLD